MNIDPKDLERIKSFYIESLISYGPKDPRAVHWSDAHNQQLRFDQIYQLGDFNISSVLDVGCGFGDLYEYLTRHGNIVDYTGIDIMTEFLDEARLRYPTLSFSEKTIFEIDTQYDYVIASGALSFKIADYKNFYFTMIEKMYALCNRGVAFNMLRQGVHIDDTEFATYDPDQVVSFCQNFCANVEIHTNYLEHDFTVFLRKKRDIHSSEEILQ